MGIEEFLLDQAKKKARKKGSKRAGKKKLSLLPVK
jgi:hypothetical protein